MDKQSKKMGRDWKERAIHVSFVKGDWLQPAFLHRLQSEMIAANRERNPNDYSSSSVIRDALKVGLPIIAESNGVSFESLINSLPN